MISNQWHCSPAVSRLLRSSIPAWRVVIRRVQHGPGYLRAGRNLKGLHLFFQYLLVLMAGAVNFFELVP